MPTRKLRNHNEWFQPLAKRTRNCTNCGAPMHGASMYAWGEYVVGKWQTVKHFCRACFVRDVATQLATHAQDCGCTITICARNGYSLPEWLYIERQQCLPFRAAEIENHSQKQGLDS